MESSYNQLICRTFEKRLGNNPSYSLRAFANSLGMNPGSLSKILTGKHQITKKTFERLAEKLDLDEIEVNLLQEEGRYPYHAIDLDQFSTMANWFYFAILELTHLQDFESDPKWIARKLGISLFEVNQAIDRLKRLGFLTEQKDGRFVDTYDTMATFDSDLTTFAQRKVQKQILEKAILAIDSVDYAKRSNSTLTFSFSQKKVGLLKQKIAALRAEFAQFLEEHQGEKDAVYHFSLSLYPVTIEFTKE